MNDDDMASTATIQQSRPQAASPTSGGLEDEFRGGGTTIAAPRPTETAQYSATEVAGDAPTGESRPDASGNEEVSAESVPAGEFAEATQAELSAEAGEESAVSDLRGIEGFEESTTTGTESAQGEEVLVEAGAVANDEGAEFLPFLAALVPTLASTVGPMIAKGIQSRLSPKAKAALGRAPAPRTPGAPSAVVPGSAGALLAQIAQLLKTMQARPGGESGMEAVDESMVNEAVAVLEVVIGKDDRVRIQNTTDIPWRRICALRITFPSNAVYRGTGFLIGPRSLATAGHCVYLHNQGGWARKVEVIPGANGPARPFGTAESTQLRSVAGWVNAKKPESDYGCIVLPQGSFNGRNLGSFGFGALTPQDLVAKPAVLAGYHGDKPFAELWGMARKIKTVSPFTLAYDIDTAGGGSGSPVYIKRGDGGRTVVGIHNYGAATGNSATRVTPAVAQRLLAWSKL